MPLSQSELVATAKRAGFDDKNAVIASAVALAESGGNPQAHNATPPDNSYGLWQINMLGSMGPERRKAFGIASNEALFDPDTNARAAYKVWKGQGWGGWTTYTRGTYRQHMPNDATSESLLDKAGRLARQPGQALSGAVSGVADAVNPVPEISGAVTAFGKTFERNVMGMIIGGFALGLIILGLLLVNRENIAKAAGAVAQVVGPGKLAKGAKTISKVM